MLHAAVHQQLPASHSLALLHMSAAALQQHLQTSRETPNAHPAVINASTEPTCCALAPHPDSSLLVLCCLTRLSAAPAVCTRLLAASAGFQAA
jgi:hypothetical protein